MDFFANQDRARALTRRLVLLFALSVLAIVVVLNLAAAVGIQSYLDTAELRAGDSGSLRLKVHGLVTLGTLVLITLGSLWKTSELSAGGPAVAAMVGARPVDRNGRNPGEQRLVNVVEEMSIASGVSMPQVFVMEDSGINAFAAGFGTSDAVVAVTRGCLDRLSRDELQGVVAHEFSHILNGDMRLNLRLIGLVHGILVLALMGSFLLRMAGSGRSSGSSRNKNGGVAAIVIIGLVLLVVGYIGHFLGQLIKAAVSRQREFLADAAAVQFTRNPDGIGGALKKIGARYTLAFVGNERSQEVSHLFLGRAVTAPWFGWLDTHPPIESRIRAINPAWDGSFVPSGPALRRDEPQAALPARARPAVVSAVSLAAGLAAAQVTSRIGTLSPERVRFSAQLLAALPPVLVTAARDPFSSRAVILAVLMGADIARSLPLLDLFDRADPALCREIRRLQTQVSGLGEGGRLPLIDLALPTLRQTSPGQQRDFLTALDLLTNTQKTLPLPIVILAILVRRRLTAPVGQQPGGIFAIAPLLPHAAVIFSALAHAGGREANETRQAFAVAVERLGVSLHQVPFLAADAIDAPRLFQALEVLTKASPGLARRLVEGCAWCVAADGQVTVQEAELLRTVCVSLGCPMPPFSDVKEVA